MAQDVTLLENFGFKQAGEGMWTFRQEYDGDSEYGHDIAVIVLAEASGGYVGYVPNVNDPVITEKIDAVPEKGLFFRSNDVRDMLAMAQNEIASLHMAVTGSAIGEGFEEDGVWIEMPYMGGDYYDYQVDSRSRGNNHLELEPPSVVWNGYLAWRDEFCEKFTAPRPAP